MTSLRHQLKRERELRGISLRQIADETKITVRFLSAIEEGRLDSIPGEFYRRSYLRAYARYLGLDETRAVNDYRHATDASTPATKVPEVSRRTHEGDSGPIRDFEGFSLSIGQWVAIGLGVFLVGWLVVASAGSQAAVVQPQESALAEQARRAATRETAAQTEPFSAPAPVVELSNLGSDTLRARLELVEPCWLQIWVDGEIVTDGLMPSGFETEVDISQEMRLMLGNAGGVSLWLDGEPAKKLGSSGQVVKDLRINRDNVAEFVSELKSTGLSSGSSPRG